MSTQTRIYVVQDTETSVNALVRASNQSQAIRHVAKGRFIAAVASQDNLVKLLSEGVDVEDAGVEVQE